MRSHLPLLALLLPLFGCPSADDDDATSDDDDATSADDDDSTSDDDDSTADDDDTGDDDDTSDDDDTGDDDDDSAGLTCSDPLFDASLATFLTWTATRSCGDAFFSVGNDEGTARLSVSVNTSELPLAPGQTWTLDIAGLTVPPMGLSGSVTAQRGTYLQSQDCVGARPPDAPVVDRTFEGFNGFVQLAIVTVDGETFTADVSFIGVRVSDGAAQCTIPDRTFTGLGFGYWPA